MITKNILSEITNIIIANEDSENWLDSVQEYCENPTDKKQEKVQEIQEIQAEHQIDAYLASILRASKV